MDDQADIAIYSLFCKKKKFKGIKVLLDTSFETHK